MLPDDAVPHPCVIAVDTVGAAKEHGFAARGIVGQCEPAARTQLRDEFPTRLRCNESLGNEENDEQTEHGDKAWMWHAKARAVAAECRCELTEELTSI